MASYGINKWFTIFTIFTILNIKQIVQCTSKVPCYFIFGDSLSDNGNNNDLDTLAKANHPPYGIDFHNGPTGRFSNGRNIADFLAEHLEFETHIPPHATATDEEIIRGVNYASGGSGIRNESGMQLGDVISLDRQLENHRTTISRLANVLGDENNVNEHLGKCLYTVWMGSNDYINNYLMPDYYASSSMFTHDQYAIELIKEYTEQLKCLYNMGARKIAVFGMGYLGFIPAEREKFGEDVSVGLSINSGIKVFNDALLPLVEDLNKNLPDAKFIYVNITSISSGDPTSLGIKDLTTPCCKVSRKGAIGQCEEREEACSNRNEHLFFDNFHPTEIVTLVTALRAYNASLPEDAYPYDIKTLVCK